MRKSKIILVTLLLFFIAGNALGQKSRKLTKDEMSKMTPEQRLVHETDRKSKHGKKEMSNQKKVKVQQKTSKRSERIKPPKQKRKSKKARSKG